eukprot:1120169-Rhodomonas_salina.1
MRGEVTAVAGLAQTDTLGSVLRRISKTGYHHVWVVNQECSRSQMSSEGWRAARKPTSAQLCEDSRRGREGGVMQNGKGWGEGETLNAGIDGGGGSV